jgi:site-specific recombinase XerD
LRHSRASALARGGASLMQIGKVLGHTAPATTARYSHLVDRDLVDLIERS